MSKTKGYSIKKVTDILAFKLEHNELTEVIAKELKDRGYNPHLYQEYRTNGACGEIDIFAIKDNYVLLFEIKKTDSIRNYNKAQKQTLRAELNCFPHNRVFRFYAYTTEDGYNIEWIRRRTLWK